MMASEIVDAPEKAQVAVTDQAVRTADGAEVIRSSDIERIMAIMN